MMESPIQGPRCLNQSRQPDGRKMSAADEPASSRSESLERIESLRMSENTASDAISKQNEQPSPRGLTKEFARAAFMPRQSHPLQEQWPLDRVLNFLAANNFSTEWLETFKALDIYGTSFLELAIAGTASNRQDTIQFKVHAGLAKEYSSRGIAWGYSQEKEESERLQLLIRNILEEQKPATGAAKDLEILERAPGSSQERTRLSPPPLWDEKVPLGLKAGEQSDDIPRDTADPAIWSLDRVLAWLISNNFSEDWQKTFESLNIFGHTFLELASGNRDRGSFGKMHQQVYPHLAQTCSKSGTGWDQAREREEGKRLRRAIRGLVTGKTYGEFVM